MKLTDKTGNLVTIKDVNDGDDLMIINKSGITIRLRMSDLRTIGRATQGVRLIKISANDEISSVAKVEAEEKDEEVDVDLSTTIDSAAVNSPDAEPQPADEQDILDDDDDLADDAEEAEEDEDESEEADLA